MQIISQEKDHAVGINGFEGVGPEWLLPKKGVLIYVLKESKIWRGREGNRSTGACLLYYLSFFLNFLSFLLYFLSYLFSLLFTLFFFLLRKNALFFPPFFRASKGPFIVPAVTNILPFCPLTASVWFGRTCQPPSLCDIHPYHTEAGLFRSSVYRNTSFLPRHKCFLSLLSRHAPNGSPSNLPLLGGLLSQ